MIAILDRHLAKIGVCCGRRSQVEPHVGQRIVLRHAKSAVLVASGFLLRIRPTRLLPSATTQQPHFISQI